MYKNKFYIFLTLFVLFSLNISNASAIEPERYNQHCNINPNSSIGEFGCRGNQLTQPEAHSFCTSRTIGMDKDLYMDCMGSFLPFIQNEISVRGCEVSGSRSVNWGYSLDGGNLNANCYGVIPAGSYRSNETVTVNTDDGVNEEFIGTANFVCDNGSFRIDNSTAICTEVARSCDVNGEIYEWPISHVGQYRYSNGKFEVLENNNGNSLSVVQSIDISDTDWSTNEINSLMNSQNCVSVASGYPELNMYQSINLIPNQGNIRTNTTSGFNFNNFILVNQSENINTTAFSDSISYMVDFCYDGNIGGMNSGFSRERFEQYNQALLSAGLINGATKESILYKKCTTYPVDCEARTLTFSGIEGGTCQFEATNMKHGLDPLRATVEDSIGSANAFVESRDFPTHGYATVSCFNGEHSFVSTPTCHLDPECKGGNRVAEAETDTRRVTASKNNFGQFGQNYTNAQLLNSFRGELNQKCKDLGFRGNAILDEDSFSVDSIELSESKKQSTFYWEYLGTRGGQESYGVNQNDWRKVNFQGNTATARDYGGSVREQITCNNNNVGAYIDEIEGDVAPNCTSNCAHNYASWRCMSSEVDAGDPDHYASKITVSAECVYIVNPNFTSEDLCEVGEHEGFIFNPSNTSAQPYFQGSSYTWTCGNGLKSGDKAYACSGADSNSGEPVGICGSNNTKTFSSLSSSNSNNCRTGSVVSFTSSDNETYRWGCSIGNSTTSCMAYKSSSCGSSNGSTFLNLKESSSNNCQIGKVQGFTITNSKFNWSCSNGSSTVSCSANRNASCGINNGNTINNLTSGNGNNCSIGSVANFSSGQSGYTWQCRNGSNTVSCSADKYAKCGTNNGKTLASISNGNSGNCSIGKDNRSGVSGGVTTHASTFTWSCYNGLRKEDCSAHRDPVCGSGHGITSSSFPNSSIRCSIGSASNTGQTNTSWTWNCNNGSKSISCSAHKTPTCGDANGRSFSSSPSTSSRCGIGSQSGFKTNSNNYTWSCGNGSESVSCSAFRNASCGSASGVTTSTAPSGSSQCSIGSPFNRGDTTLNWNWGCSNGSGAGSTSVNCTAPKSPTCGTANGGTFSSSPATSARCGRGGHSNFKTNSSDYTWLCNNGGQSTSCSAYRGATCGSSNGGTFSSSPSTGSRCGIGSQSNFKTNTSNYTWSCKNGSSTANCSAYRNPVCGNSFYQCSRGTMTSSTVNHATTALWTCSNGSASVSCNMSKGQTNGSCGSSRNTCSSGSVGNRVGPLSTNPQYTWSCSGGRASGTERQGVSVSCGAGENQPNCNTSSQTPRCHTGIVSGINNKTATIDYNCVVNNTQGWSGWNKSRSCVITKNAECGSAASGGATSSRPTSNLCNVGSKANEGSTSSLWTWDCKNGTKTASCSRARTQQQQNPDWGCCSENGPGWRFEPLAGGCVAPNWSGEAAGEACR